MSGAQRTVELESVFKKVLQKVSSSLRPGSEEESRLRAVQESGGRCREDSVPEPLPFRGWTARAVPPGCRPPAKLEGTCAGGGGGTVSLRTSLRERP